MNYIRALAKACTGPSAFVELCRQGGWQAFRHMLATAFLCGVLYAVLFAVTQSGEIARANARFEAEFGEVAVFEDAFLPEKMPERSRTILLDGFTSVAYLASGAADDAEEEPVLMPPEALRGVVWTPGNLWMWMLTSRGATSDKDELIVAPGLTGTVTRGEFIARVRQESAAPAAVGPGREIGRFSPGQWYNGTVLGIASGFAWFFGIAFLACFFCGIFVLTTGLLGGSRNLSRKEMWVTLLYAGLPVMVIGTVVQALELGFDYSTVYIFGLVGYLLFILRRIERTLHPPPPKEKEDDSDMDF